MLQQYLGVLMQAVLLHNGYHLQRRRLDPFNPRNNLVSQVQLEWRQPLEDDQTPSSRLRLSRRSEDIEQLYNMKIDAKLAYQLNLRSSETFKVIPSEASHEGELRQEASSQGSLKGSQTIDWPGKIQLPKIGKSVRKQKCYLDDLIERGGNRFFRQMLSSRLARH